MTCRLCGECDVGCNYGSKNTLDYTYLSAAQRHGGLLRTGCEMIALAPRTGGGYTVRYREHPLDQQVEAAHDAPVLHTLTADRLILAAGTIGTTHLLLTNRSAFPHVSNRLGTRFCGNGDRLTCALNASEERDGARVPCIIDAAYGPVITAAVRVPDTEDGGVARGLYLEDAGFPAHLTWLLEALDLPKPVCVAPRRPTLLVGLVWARQRSAPGQPTLDAAPYQWHWSRRAAPIGDGA